jgi:hypothetical protein
MVRHTKRCGAIAVLTALFIVGLALPAAAQDAAAMARKLQDPLANIKALMTDNDVNFNTGTEEDEVSYGFQLQPVYAIPFEKQGFNLVNRAVIPILGITPGGQKSILGEPLPAGGSRTWGLSDSLLQFFFSPRTDDPWKWGVGPMVSLRTRTDDDLAGPGWGGGIGAVLVGNIGEHVSTAFIGGHVWGDEDGFSTSMLQPMIFYNLPNAWNIHYNNMITYDWNADSGGNSWTVPLGLAVGKMFNVGGGHGIELFVGPYYNVVRPDGAAEWALKFGLNWLIP